MESQGWGHRNEKLNGYGASIWEKEKCQELDDGGTTMGRYAMLRPYSITYY
jgi:hypothetical protein